MEDNFDQIKQFDARHPKAPELNNVGDEYNQSYVSSADKKVLSYEVKKEAGHLGTGTVAGVSVTVAGVVIATAVIFTSVLNNQFRVVDNSVLLSLGSADNQVVLDYNFDIQYDRSGSIKVKLASPAHNLSSESYDFFVDEHKDIVTYEETSIEEGQSYEDQKEIYQEKEVYTATISGAFTNLIKTNEYTFLVTSIIDGIETNIYSEKIYVPSYSYIREDYQEEIGALNFYYDSDTRSINASYYSTFIYDQDGYVYVEVTHLDKNNQIVDVKKSDNFYTTDPQNVYNQGENYLNVYGEMNDFAFGDTYIVKFISVVNNISSVCYSFKSVCAGDFATITNYVANAYKTSNSETAWIEYSFDIETPFDTTTFLRVVLEEDNYIDGNSHIIKYQESDNGMYKESVSGRIDNIPLIEVGNYYFIETRTIYAGNEFPSYGESIELVEIVAYEIDPNAVHMSAYETADDGLCVSFDFELSYEKSGQIYMVILDKDGNVAKTSETKNITNTSGVLETTDINFEFKNYTYETGTIFAIYSIIDGFTALCYTKELVGGVYSNVDEYGFDVYIEDGKTYLDYMIYYSTGASLDMYVKVSNGDYNFQTTKVHYEFDQTIGLINSKELIGKVEIESLNGAYSVSACATINDKDITYFTEEKTPYVSNHFTGSITSIEYTGVAGTPNAKVIYNVTANGLAGNVYAYIESEDGYSAYSDQYPISTSATNPTVTQYIELGSTLPEGEYKLYIISEVENSHEYVMDEGTFIYDIDELSLTYTRTDITPSAAGGLLVSYTIDILVNGSTYFESVSRDSTITYKSSEYNLTYDNSMTNPSKHDISELLSMSEPGTYDLSIYLVINSNKRVLDTAVVTVNPDGTIVVS